MTYRSNSVSDKQNLLIQRLLTERIVTINAMPEDERASLLVAPTTSKGASSLINRLLSIPADKKQASPEAVAEIDSLRAVVNKLPQRGREFAISLIQQFDQRGSLSDRQWPYVKSLILQGQDNQPEPVEPGLYRVDGSVVKVYLTDRGRPACKRLIVLGSGRGSFRYERGLLGKVRPEHRLTEDEAQAFGRQHGLCCACARHLDDDRSLAVGYGPVCADHYGWHYPNYEEASKILNRPAV
jgi:hypothetical protein